MRRAVDGPFDNKRECGRVISVTNGKETVGVIRRCADNKTSKSNLNS